MSGAAERPVTLLLAALGGEGGGVLAGWIVKALEQHGLVVQSTAIPGVAQRTGATTYYIEALPIPAAELGDRRPVLSLYPTVGDVDIMVASELVEAGRAIQNGFVTPDRTVLFASTHRHYAIGERAAMGDGRFAPERVEAAAEARSRRAIMADFAALAHAHGTSLNAVLLGLIAGNQVLPVPAEAFEDAVRATAIAVEANLKGVAVGIEWAAADRPPLPAEASYRRWHATPVGAVEERARAEFPQALHEVVVEGVRRLVGYQGAGYAASYLDRLAAIRGAEEQAGGDLSLTRETARHLALWMSFQDVIRVAQLKTDPERRARVLAEIGASESDPVIVTEFIKPGIEELCSVLPPALARRILGWSERHKWLAQVQLGMKVKTTTVSGFLRLWLLARLRRWRPRSHRFAQEQAAIEDWLSLIRRAAGGDLVLAREIVECARLIKGYGDTHRRGMANFRRIRVQVIEPALAGTMAAELAADALANARVAALADADGTRLGQVLAAISDGAAAPAAG